MEEVKLPKAIQDQLDQAEAIQKQIDAESAPPANTDEVNQIEEVPEQQVEQQVEQPAVAEPPQPQAEDWEQKFKVISGKYSAEVPRLHDQLRDAQNQLASLNRKVEELATKPVETPKPKVDVVTESDKDTFGEDLVEFVSRVQKGGTSEVLDRIAAIEQAVKTIASVKQRVEEVANTQIQSKEETFWGSVNDQVPDWAQVDADPRWVDFLNSTPAFSKRTYRALAADAIATFDVEPIVAMVKTWKDAMGIKTQASSDKPPRELAAQVTPNRTGSSAPPPAAKKVWTGAEYEAAFDPRLARNKPAAEIEALQQEAELALTEGRIRW